MKILILGGDGYLGWATAMDLSSIGHDVCVVDNYSRRTICNENDIRFLFDAPSLEERCSIWKMHTGKLIECLIGDLQDWQFVSNLFDTFKPETIIHYAEQPSAPYSMKDRNSAAFTLQNNIMVTFNIIQAVKQFTPEAHIIKLGTMGEYGTPNIEIEEGWLEIEHKGRADKFLFPRQAGSLYHTTKIMDTDLLWFYVRVWGLKVTDLMQGPVYGIHTQHTCIDDKLLPLFNYDELFGTVLNRFIVQAACQYPLTIYGKGSQKRGFLNIKDTLACVRLAVENPVKAGELRVFNQFTEVFSVSDLAEKVAKAGSMLGLDVEVKTIKNPRIEAEEHFYQPAHTGLLDLGLRPHLLTDDVMSEMLEVVIRHKNRINLDQIFKGISWNQQSTSDGLKVA